MSFASDLWDKFELLVKVSSQKRKQIEDFLGILQEIIELEENYAKNVEKIGNGLTSIIDQGTISIAFASLKSAQMHKSEQSKQQANSLKLEVIEPLRELVKKQNVEVKKMTLDGKKLEKELRVRLEDSDKIKAKYLNKCKLLDEAEMLNECLKNFKDATSEKKNKYFLKVEQLEKEKSHYESKFKSILEGYNTFIDEYAQEMGKIHENFQKHEEQRLQLLKGSITCAIKINIASIKSTLNDLEKISKRIEHVDKDRDILTFIEENKTERPFFQKMVFETYSSFLGHCLKDKIAGEETMRHSKSNGQLTQDFLIISEFQRYFEQIVRSREADNFEFNKEIDSEHKDIFERLALIVQKAWEGEEITPEIMKEFNFLIKNKLRRKLWIFAFQHYRLKGKFQLSENGFNNIKLLIYCILSMCMNEKDVSTAKKTMILTFTYYKFNACLLDVSSYSPREEKIYLHSELTDHPIWKSVDFWECAIFLSVREEFEVQKSYNLEEKETKSETLKREKNIVFGQLASYQHNMMIFEMDKNDVRNILLNFCRIYCLSEQQVKDLTSLIDTFNKASVITPRHKSFPLDSLYKDLEYSSNNKAKHPGISNSSHQRNFEAYEEYLKEYADDVLLKLPYSPTLEKFKSDKRRAKSQEKDKNEAVNQAETTRSMMEMNNEGDKGGLFPDKRRNDPCFKSQIIINSTNSENDILFKLEKNDKI